jgi:Bifunctional DNA primase/polymerase, N-terminal
MPMYPPSHFLNAALTRAEEGWAVHPLFGIGNGRCECNKGMNCDTPGKHPRLKGWQEHATTDQNQIRQWWQRHPYSNIGGAAGKKSGRDVLDVDPRHGGDVNLDLLEAQYNKLPETQESITGSGGRHLDFAYSGVSLSNTAGVLGPGLDIRSDGGNVVLPGSLHISGRLYEYEIFHGPEDVSLAPMPMWLLVLLRAQGNKKVSRAVAPGPLPNGSVHFTFVSWAGSMHHRGISPGAILTALLHENQTRCDPVRPEENIRKLVEDITSRYEPGQVPPPRELYAQVCQREVSVQAQQRRAHMQQRAATARARLSGFSAQENLRENGDGRI